MRGLQLDSQPSSPLAARPADPSTPPARSKAHGEAASEAGDLIQASFGKQLPEQDLGALALHGAALLTHQVRFASFLARCLPTE